MGCDGLKQTIVQWVGMGCSGLEWNAMGWDGLMISTNVMFTVMNETCSWSVNLGRLVSWSKVALGALQCNE